MNYFTTEEVNKTINAAVRATKEKAIEAFRQFVEDYANESGKAEIKAESKGYMNVFKELLNKEDKDE